jgi:hypothetical protein
MALVIQQDKSYNWPVNVSEPMDGGTFKEHKIGVRFKMLSQDRLNEIIKNDNEEDEDVLNEILVGWDNEAFKDGNGNSLPFNEENKALILSVPFVRKGLIDGFRDSLAGKAYKRKN